MEKTKRFSLRIGFVVLAMAVAAGVWAGSASAAYPEKTITLIVPWSAGGGSDRSMRLVADEATRRLGVPVVVVNRSGAGGARGTRVIAKANPDGYTIGMVGSGVTARQYSNPNATPIEDLQTIAHFGSDPGAFSVRADTGWKTLADFVKYAKANPGKIRNGNDNPGGMSHIVMSVIEARIGIQVNKVPYKGYAPTVAALLAGEIQTASVPVNETVEHHKAGKVRILGIAGAERHYLAPDVPTFKEQGYDVAIGAWRSIVAPKGIRPEYLKVLEEKFLETLRDKAFQARARKAGFIVSPLGSKETWQLWVNHDKALYPVLVEAGLVKVRRK